MPWPKSRLFLCNRFESVINQLLHTHDYNGKIAVVRSLLFLHFYFVGHYCLVMDSTIFMTIYISFFLCFFFALSIHIRAIENSTSRPTPPYNMYREIVTVTSFWIRRRRRQKIYKKISKDLKLHTVCLFSYRNF